MYTNHQHRHLQLASHSISIMFVHYITTALIVASSAFAADINTSSVERKSPIILQQHLRPHLTVDSHHHRNRQARRNHRHRDILQSRLNRHLWRRRPHSLPRKHHRHRHHRRQDLHGRRSRRDQRRQHDQLHPHRRHRLQQPDLHLHHDRHTHHSHRNCRPHYHFRR